MWQTPKTDWEIKPLINGLYQGDWFNVEDYNRIIGNLRYLHAAGQNVYDVAFSILGMSTKDRTGFPRAGDINALEDNLYAITQSTYNPPDYSGKKTWAGNGATPTVDDLNRLERACAAIYAQLNETPLRTYITVDGETFVANSQILKVR